MTSIEVLFPDIATLRRYAPGISSGDNLEALQGILSLAEKQIRRVLGKTILDRLVEEPSTSELGSNIRSAFANLLLLKTITFDAVKKRQTSETEIYKYELEAMRREYNDNYYNSMDSLLSIISEAPSFSADWKRTRWAGLLDSVPIKSCDEFDNLYPIDLSFLFFFRTLPFQREIYLDYEGVFSKIKTLEDEEEGVVNYAELSTRLRIAFAKLVISLALERMDMTELPATIRNLFVDQKSTRGKEELSTLALQLRGEASTAISAVVIAMSESPSVGGSGICADENDKIILIP